MLRFVKTRVISLQTKSTIMLYFDQFQNKITPKIIWSFHIFKLFCLKLIKHLLERTNTHSCRVKPINIYLSSVLVLIHVTQRFNLPFKVRILKRTKTATNQILNFKFYCNLKKKRRNQKLKSFDSRYIQILALSIDV